MLPMTDLDRLIEVLKKNNVEFETIPVKEDEIDKRYDKYADRTILWVSEVNELLALHLRSLSAVKTTGIFNEVLNHNFGSCRVFPRLKYLSVSQCSLKLLPESFQQLSHIERLAVHHSHLQDLPDWLQNFRNLKSLELDGNKIHFDCLPKLRNLEELSIAYFKTPLSDSIQRYSNLKKLDIDGNGLLTLPDWLQNLKHLESLSVYNNNLESLPDWLQKFNNLNFLYIGENPLKTIPPALLDMSHRINISTNNLSIADVPDEIIAQGWEAIRLYYSEQAGETSLADEKDDVPYTATELKVMIIGAGSSGKSSISKAMNHDEHDPNQASTVGIALKNIPCKFREQDWTLRVWDFGGQEAYAATQTLFMTKNTLYLVVADGRTENRPDPYLSYIDTFAPESPVILIINKVDENERADLNRQIYLKEHSNLHPHMIRFSCVNDSDKCVQELLGEIESVLFGSEYGPQLQAQWTPRWRTVRNDLIELLAKNKTYIDADEYYALCKDKKLPEGAWEVVRNACHILGIVFSYKNPNANPPIDRILHPEWVTNGINSLCKLSENGLYLAKDIYPHMRNQGYSDNETLSILAIFQAEELAILLPDQHFFIPALLPGKPPPNFPVGYDDWCMDEDGKSKACEIRFRYPFLHPVVKQKFMVKLCQRGMEIQAFRFGACWNKNGVRVVMMEETDDLVFYLQGDDDKALCDERIIIEEMMETLHNERQIKSTLVHVFRTVDMDGKTRLSAEYSEDDLWTLKEMMEKGIMKDNHIPLPGIKKVLSVDEILYGYRKNAYKERTSDMCNTTNILGNQTILQNSPGAVATGGNVKDSTITTSVGPTPNQTLFAEETSQAVNMIKSLRGLNRSHRDAMITYLDEANDATQADDEGKIKSCKEKFAAFIAGAGKAINKALKALSDFATIASFFGLGEKK